MRRLTFTAAVAWALLAGCGGLAPLLRAQSQRFREPVLRTEKLASGARVTVETFNGKIELSGWDRKEASIEVTKSAAREETLRDIEVDIFNDGGALRVRVRRPAANCNCGATVAMRLPQRVTVEEARTSNGDISIGPLEADGTAITSNGDIQLWDVRGDWTLRTANGGIRLDRAEGAFTARTSNGRIRISALRGRVDAATSNSSIDAEIREPAAGAPLVFRSSNGSVTVKLDQWARNPLRVATSNGSITLALPGGVDADVQAVTSNGRITSDFEITSREWGRRRLEGRLGAGGERLELSTSNGNIRLVRR